ncbi:MAG: hypothetical protein QF824_03300 [Candidatus Woesearchaeota archaeon]|jgi:DNA polymerase elongation subunit (family B)|nr:hypothetical protein [Candidatus Woesearchaeota archaeon]
MVERHLLYGDDDNGIVAVEHVGQEAVLFRRDSIDDLVTAERQEFHPYVLATDAVFDNGIYGRMNGGGLVEGVDRLHGEGYDRIVYLRDMEAWDSFVRGVIGKRSIPSMHNLAQSGLVYGVNRNPVMQFKVKEGKTEMKGIEYSDVRRMTVDVQALSTVYRDGLKEQNRFMREGPDNIVCISFATKDYTSTVRTYSYSQGVSEKDLINVFVNLVMGYDPDVLEFTNLDDFRLLWERAQFYGMDLFVGRELPGVPERMLLPQVEVGGYDGQSRAAFRRHVFGRQVVETRPDDMGDLFIPDRIVEEGIGERIGVYMDYLRMRNLLFSKSDSIGNLWLRSSQDVKDFSHASALSAFGLSEERHAVRKVKAQMSAASFEGVMKFGDGTHLNHMVMREYLRAGLAIPVPEPIVRGKDEKVGGETRASVGLFTNGAKYDFESHWPKTSIINEECPSTDELGVHQGLNQLEVKDHLHH